MSENLLEKLLEILKKHDFEVEGKKFRFFTKNLSLNPIFYLQCLDKADKDYIVHFKNGLKSPKKGLLVDFEVLNNPDYCLFEVTKKIVKGVYFDNKKLKKEVGIQEENKVNIKETKENYSLNLKYLFKKLKENNIKIEEKNYNIKRVSYKKSPRFILEDTSGNCILAFEQSLQNILHSNVLFTKKDEKWGTIVSNIVIESKEDFVLNKEELFLKDAKKVEDFISLYNKRLSAKKLSFKFDLSVVQIKKIKKELIKQGKIELYKNSKKEKPSEKRKTPVNKSNNNKISTTQNNTEIKKEPVKEIKEILLERIKNSNLSANDLYSLINLYQGISEDNRVIDVCKNDISLENVIQEIQRRYTELKENQKELLKSIKSTKKTLIVLLLCILLLIGTIGIKIFLI